MHYSLYRIFVVQIFIYFKNFQNGLFLLSFVSDWLSYYEIGKNKNQAG